MEADMIELDVLLTKDGVPVVIHDNNLERLAGIKGMITDTDYEEVQKMDVGSWFAISYKEERIPTLREVLSWAKDRISLNIEIKAESVTDQAAGGIEEKVIHLIREYEMEEYVLLSSFDYRAVERFTLLAPEIASAILYDKDKSKGKAASGLMRMYKSSYFNVNWRYLTLFSFHKPDIDAHLMMVYTVNSRRLMRKLLRKGVNGIFSDRPDLLKVVADKEISERYG
jgi:glycerophosphoryl diester phosphodiesterase